MGTKKKVIKRKLNIKRVLIAILILLVIILSIYLIIIAPIKNIYIVGNNYIKDNEIIRLAGIEDYPSFIKFNKNKAKKNILSNNYIGEINIEKKLFNKVIIKVKEKKILCEYNNMLLLEDALLLENKYNIYGYPILNEGNFDINKLSNKLSLVDDNILLKISEINYVPNDVDKERFLFRMNDDNLVYVTLKKINKINKYNDISLSLENKKGIIYLDSGDYVEVRDNN